MWRSWKSLSLIGLGLLGGIGALWLPSVLWDTIIVPRHLNRLPQIQASLLPEAQALAKQELDTKIAQHQFRKNQLAVKSHYLPVYAKLKYIMTVSVLSLGFAGGLGSLVVYLWIYWKRQTTYRYKIGENEIVVPEKELPHSTTIALGLITAEQLKQQNSGLDRAFDLYRVMAETQTKLIMAMGKHRPMLSASPLGDIPVRRLSRTGSRC